MVRYYTHYWANRTCKDFAVMGLDGEVLNHTAGNLFRKTGIKPADIIYVVTVIKGQLFIVGKLEVKLICNQNEAGKLLKCEPSDLWEAEEHVIASKTIKMKFNRGIPSNVTENLEFVSGGKSSKPPKFKYPGHLDQQTLRGVRELTSSSALLLDEKYPELKKLTPV